MVKEFEIGKIVFNFKKQEKEIGIEETIKQMDILVIFITFNTYIEYDKKRRKHIAPSW